MKIYTQSRIVAACAQFLKPHEIVYTRRELPLGDGRVMCFEREKAWTTSSDQGALDAVRHLESYAFEIEDFDKIPIRDGFVEMHDPFEDRVIRITLEEFATLRNMSFGKWRAQIPTRYVDKLYAVSGIFFKGYAAVSGNFLNGYTLEEVEATVIISGKTARRACLRAVMKMGRLFDGDDVKFYKKGGRRYEVREVPKGCDPEESGRFDLSGVFYCKVYNDDSDSWN